jgi:hypothetical protein
METQDMGARERIEKYRKSGGAADLVRVEVLVPEGGKRSVIELAAVLRAGERRKKAALGSLLSHAMERYSARVLDNLDLNAITDLSVKSKLAGNALIEKGDARAFVLGRRLLEMAGV